MTTDTDRWRRLRAVFSELADLPAAEQTARLEEMTFGDADLRAEVEALLVAAREMGDRFEDPVGMPDDLETDAEPPVVGSRIGAYQIVGEIGRGGMGTVYLGLRADGDFAKRVAIKMVPRGRDSEAILRRFRYERQILARLEHRNIASLIDGGVTADGRPYFAMEFVEGERIDRYCDRSQLGIRARLQLFRQVCAAVQYAHQNLVVHRDLKPSNILVGPDGTVKLLDFGIAKLLDPNDDEERLTQSGLLPMTTAYASPEQLKGEPVTTATDVYSLGVVLYELLSGRPPFVDGELPVLEVRRRMVDQTPVPPSLAATAETAVASGEGTTDRLKRALAGELDNVVLMALRKEPERRYASAEQLSEDLLRFLAGLPIQAQPDSVGYRTRKFIRRNRVAVAAAAIAVVALAAGTVVSIWQLRHAQAERQRAQAARQTADQVTDFFRSVLTAAKPANLGPKATILEAIDAAVAQFDSSFSDQPSVRAALGTSLASTLNELGFPERALPLARDAHLLRQAIDSGRVTWEGATAAYNLAYVFWGKGQLAEAESLMRRSLAWYEEAGEDPTEIAAGYGSLASLLGDQGKLDQVVDLQGKSLAALRRRPGNSRSLIVAIGNYAVALSQRGRYPEALPLLQEAVDRAIDFRGPSDPLVATSLQPLAFTLFYLGRAAEADPLALRAYQIANASLGPAHPTTVASLRSVAEIRAERGLHDDAIAKATELIGYRGKGLEDSDPNLGAAYVVLARSLAATGKLAEAEQAARESLALRLRFLAETHWLVAHSRSVLGEVLSKGARDGEAEPLLVGGLAGLERELGPDNPRTRQARARLEAFRKKRHSGGQTPPR